MALHRPPHLQLIAIVGINEVGADQKQNYVISLDMLVDLAGKLLPGSDPPIMPGLDDPLPPEERELSFQLVPQRFVSVRVSKEYLGHLGPPLSKDSGGRPGGRQGEQGFADLAKEAERQPEAGTLADRR
jgi:hypothetical protein